MAINAFQIPSLFEVRFVDHPSGCERPHTHTSLIVSAVLDGYISLQVNDNESCLKKGVVAAVGPNILHCVCSYSHDFAGVYILEVFGLPAVYEQFDAIHFQMFKNLLLHDNTTYSNFINLCRGLLLPIDSLQKIELLSEWLHTLFENHYPSQIEAEPGQNVLADKIRRVLEDYEGESPPFEKISQLCNRSKEHCNRIFRRSYNISIQAYFLNQKAVRARNLLSSNKSLSEIASECGFYDQSHFSRVFKEIFQISPAKYRAIISPSYHSHTIHSN
jgi:AraC-like DNA-binding protein